jgi:hypothetical protein
MGEWTRAQHEQNVDVIVHQLFKDYPEFEALENLGFHAYSAIWHATNKSAKEAMRETLDKLAKYQPTLKKYNAADIFSNLAIAKYLEPRLQNNPIIRKALDTDNQNATDFLHDLAAKLDGSFYQKLSRITEPADV